MKKHAREDLDPFAHGICRQPGGDQSISGVDPADAVSFQPPSQHKTGDIQGDQQPGHCRGRVGRILNRDGEHGATLSRKLECLGLSRQQAGDIRRGSVLAFLAVSERKVKLRSLRLKSAGTSALGLLLLFMFCLPGCGGAQFDGVEYRDKEVAFRLGPTPVGAVQLKSNDAKLAFQNDQIGATVAVSARCGLDSDDVPLQALVQHLFLQIENRQTVTEQSYTLDDRAALEVELVADLDGVRRHFVVVVLKKNGCVYDFLHVDGDGSDARLAQSRADFRRMVKGFRTL